MQKLNLGRENSNQQYQKQLSFVDKSTKFNHKIRKDRGWAFKLLILEQ